MLDGQPLFRVRGISVYPAAQRAQAISERIATIAADRSVTPDALVVIGEGTQSRIVAGDRLVDVFNEHGVQIMTAAYEGDHEQPKVVAKEQWFAAPAVRHGSEPDTSA